MVTFSDWHKKELLLPSISWIWVKILDDRLSSLMKITWPKLNSYSFNDSTNNRAPSCTAMIWTLEACEHILRNWSNCGFASSIIWLVLLLSFSVHQSKSTTLPENPRSTANWEVCTRFSLKDFEHGMYNRVSRFWEWGIHFGQWLTCQGFSQIQLVPFHLGS